MKKFFLILTVFFYFFSCSANCFTSYLRNSTPGQKALAAGLLLGSIGAIVGAAKDKPYDGIGLGCLAFSAIFASPLVNDAFDTRQRDCNCENYRRTWPRCCYAAAALGLSLAGCTILRKSHAGAF